jgi:hypothetical protein
MPKVKFNNDRYRKARGGYSRLLDVSCAKCGRRVCLYQKDGAGILKRMYVDRMQSLTKVLLGSSLVCTACKEVLGTKIVYKKENRPAYRLFAGAVSKKITKA